MVRYNTGQEFKAEEFFSHTRSVRTWDFHAEQRDK